MNPLRVLILGGSAEASALARSLVGDRRFAPVLSLAGSTRSPALPPIPYRIGGFGGVDGLAHWLAEEPGVDLLVCATHPFAVQMRRHAVEAARRTGKPLLIVERPAWRPAKGARWIAVGDMAAAARALGQAPRRVLLTIGQKDLSAFVGAPQHAYVIRSIDPPAPESLPPGAEVISARPPFGEADERRLLETHGIEVMVTKNSGGDDTAAKLDAARALGVTVVMIERPPAVDFGGLDVARASDVAGVMAWLEDRHEAAS
jgi:precorrin-6A/cobalt-precorrin-6A reductase